MTKRAAGLIPPEDIMKLPLITASLAGILSVAAVGEAAAWTRSGSVTTARGAYTGSASGGCAYGTCSRTRTVTGPYGSTASRTGSVTRTSPYTYNYSRTATGPYGGSVTRNGAVVVNPY